MIVPTRRAVLAAALLSLVLLFPAGSGPVAAEAASSGAAAGKAHLIPIKGDIEPSLAAFVRREATSALDADASFLVFEIDTFGGRVDTALQITSFIGSIKKAKTVAWIRGGSGSMGVSWSAGALIAMSCSEIYMAEGTSIGAAAPVTIGADGKPESAGEKTTSAVRSQMAALAEKNGYPSAIALAMVDADVELWEATVSGQVKALTSVELERLEKEKGSEVVRGAIICAKGKLLSLTAGEAARYGLSRGTADEIPSLLAALGAEGEAVETEISLADRLVAVLVSGPAQALLILVGLVALFLEINTPGFGIPGAIAIVSFLGVFGANALLGSVGSFELILFLLGVGLLAVEIFVTPGFGVVGVSGLLSIGAALVFSMQDFVVPDAAWEWELFGRNLLVVAFGIAAAVVGIAAIALAGPKLRMFDRLTLKTSIRGTAGGPDVPDAASSDLPPADAEEEGVLLASLLGKRGTASTTLRPVGRADIDGRAYNVEADGKYVSEGTAVEVVRVRGNRIVVKPVAGSASPDGAKS